MQMDRKILEIISGADDEDIIAIMEELTKRQKQLHPDWEGMYLSFPLKQPEECRMILETAWNLLRDIMEDGAVR